MVGICSVWWHGTRASARSSRTILCFIVFIELIISRQIVCWTHHCIARSVPKVKKTTQDPFAFPILDGDIVHVHGWVVSEERTICSFYAPIQAPQISYIFWERLIVCIALLIGVVWPVTRYCQSSGNLAAHLYVDFRVQCYDCIRIISQWSRWWCIRIIHYFSLFASKLFSTYFLDLLFE